MIGVKRTEIYQTNLPSESDVQKYIGQNVFRFGSTEAQQTNSYSDVISNRFIIKAKRIEVYRTDRNQNHTYEGILDKLIIRIRRTELRRTDL